MTLSCHRAGEHYLQGACEDSCSAECLCAGRALSQNAALKQEKLQDWLRYVADHRSGRSKVVDATQKRLRLGPRSYKDGPEKPITVDLSEAACYAFLYQNAPTRSMVWDTDPPHQSVYQK